MGNVLRRGVKNFNVENRAHRVLDRKPKSAPKHPSSLGPQKDDVVDSVLPGIETLQKKDERLLNMLQGINVDSSGNNTEVESLKDMGSRLLPADRQRRPEQTQLWDDVKHVPEGRLTVPQALQLLAKHQRNKNEWPVERLAQEYKLNPLDTQNIVEYFQTFKVINIGPKVEDKAKSLQGTGKKKLIT